MRQLGYDSLVSPRNPKQQSVALPPLPAYAGSHINNVL